MNLGITPAAAEEVEAAFLYYESQVPGLGFQFLSALEEGYRHILSNPKAWTALPSKSSLRRCLLRRFPYGLIYEIVGNGIAIYAVMHLSRKPGYWKGRPGGHGKRKIH
jgi:hypothetical protein